MQQLRYLVFYDRNTLMKLSLLWQFFYLTLVSVSPLKYLLGAVY